MKINFLIPVYLIQATLLFVLLLLVLGLTTLYYIAPEPHPEVDEDEVEFIEKVKDWFDKEQVGQENESDNTTSWDSQDRLEADVSFYECTVCHNQFPHWTHLATVSRCLSCDLEMAEEMRQPSLETGM